jgi:hypothetical protein
MPIQPYATDGDQGFIGLNSRDNPVTLQQGLVTKSQNFRFNRGIAEVRKGAKRYTFEALVGQTVFGCCTYTNSNGNEVFVLVVSDGLYVYDPDTNTESVKIQFPAGETISSSDLVDVYQAQGSGYVYITRGFSKTTLRWDGQVLATGHVVVPSNTAHHNYPNSIHAIYYGNRHIVQIDQNTIRVSHYLEDSKWSALDMFSISDGSNDKLVAIAPWTLNEFVIFMRNSIFYASVGVGAYLLSDPATEDNSYVKSLATDIGCLAKRSIVQAGGGILFLSDNGVYLLNPASASGASQASPEGVRLITLSEPVSAPIDDVIQRINYNYIQNACAIYWENRYYLAVPLDSSEVNNAVLVFNFINKSWESVDVYPSGFDIHKFLVAKKGNRRRLWAVDKNDGVFLLEELNWDEYGAGVGTPKLDDPLCRLDTEGCRFTTTSYTPNTIQGILTTRAYTFQTHEDKRFSTVKSDLNFNESGEIDIDFITTNPDTETGLIAFSPISNEDYLLRLPVRKIAYSSQVRFTVNSYRPTIRSVQVDAINVGRNTATKP